MSDLFDQFKKDISENNIVLYMKGTKDSPKCGFSTAVVKVLENLGLEFKDVDVMEDDRIREGIKQFTNWPTLPQLYIKGEFVGGCDIVRELYKNGELQEIFKKHNLL
ncbi:MAG: Grx4 family monothiol glutaredoxin [Proteobacteria bacterium]|nr:Grx4 family monothiol glutaredoxin [Pseudomonadota bacterium]